MSRFQSYHPVDPYLPPLGGRPASARRSELLRGLGAMFDEATLAIEASGVERARQWRRDLAPLTMPGGSTIVRAYEARADRVDDSRRTIRARIGSACVDRYRTVIDPMGIQLGDYGRNPVVLWEHGRDPARGSMPIGKCTHIGAVVGPNGPEMVAEVSFFRDDEFAETLWRRYRDGDMRAWSVNVVPYPADCSPPTRSEVKARPELAECEMMYRRSGLAEFSAVSVGGNAEALTLDGGRSFGRLAFAY